MSCAGNVWTHPLKYIELPAQSSPSQRSVCVNAPLRAQSLYERDETPPLAFETTLVHLKSSCFDFLERDGLYVFKHSCMPHYTGWRINKVTVFSVPYIRLKDD